MAATFSCVKSVYGVRGIWHELEFLMSLNLMISDQTVYNRSIIAKSLPVRSQVSPNVAPSANVNRKGRRVLTIQCG